MHKSGSFAGARVPDFTRPCDPERLERALRYAKLVAGCKPFAPAASFAVSLKDAQDKAVDYLRRYRPESLDEPLPSGDARAEVIAGSAPGALEQLLERERAGWLVEAVAELPLPFREVLTLRFEEEMQLEEIAGVLSLPLGTVKTRLHRALKHLRRMLEMKSGVTH